MIQIRSGQSGVNGVAVMWCDMMWCDVHLLWCRTCIQPVTPKKQVQLIRAILMRNDWVFVAASYEVHTTTFQVCRRQGEPRRDNTVNPTQAPIGQALMHSHTCLVSGSLIRNFVEYKRISGPNMLSATSKIAGQAAISWAIGITMWALTRLYVFKGRGKLLSNQSGSIVSSASRQVWDCSLETADMGKRKPSSQYCCCCVFDN